MKSFYLFLLALGLASCSRSTSDVKVIVDPGPVNIAEIFPVDSIALVREGYSDTVLMSDNFFAEGDEVYFNEDGVQDAAVSMPISLMEIPNFDLSIPDLDDIFGKGYPEVFAESDPFFSVDSFPPYSHFRLYWKSECNRNMPGFNAPCMATFGWHKFWGKSMDWTVNAHKKCGRGKSFCLETKRIVGTIRYYQTKNCSDTLFTPAAIERFACK